MEINPKLQKIYEFMATPLIYVSPDGKWRIRVYPGGKFEPVGRIPKAIGEEIEKQVLATCEIVPVNSSSAAIFERMGWARQTTKLWLPK